MNDLDQGVRVRTLTCVVDVAISVVTLFCFSLSSPRFNCRECHFSVFWPHISTCFVVGACMDRCVHCVKENELHGPDNGEQDLEIFYFGRLDENH